MKINVRVKPHSRVEGIEESGKNNFILSVKAAAKENQANERAVELLSKYFDVPKSQISIIRGQKCKNKVISIGK